MRSLTAAALLLTLLAVEASSQGRWQPDDRILLTSFHEMLDIASGDGELYVLSAKGLLVLDTYARSWDVPSTGEDGFPAHEGPAALAYDPAQREVWVGTREGTLYTYHVDFRRWTRESGLEGRSVARLLTHRDRNGDGVDALTREGWFRVPRRSGFPSRLPTSALGPQHRLLELDAAERLARADPGFAADRGTVLTDERGRPTPLAAFARAEGEERYWLATAGAGLLSYDSRFLRSEPYPFGTLTDGVSSVAGRGRDVWMAGDGLGPRRGVTRADRDLRSWEHYEAGEAGAASGPFFDALALEDGVWLATSQGSYFLEESGRWRRAVGVAGRVAARRLARGPGGAPWAATEVGALRLRTADTDPEERSAYEDRRRVWAMAQVGEAVWLSTDRGIRVYGPGEPLALEGITAGEGAPTGPVTELVSLGDTVWAASSEALWHFDGKAWRGPLREPVLAMGPIRRLRALEGEVWIAGESGAARRSADDGEWDYLSVPEDIPRGPVHDVFVNGAYVWLASPAGVVRFDRRQAF